MEDAVPEEKKNFAAGKLREFLEQNRSGYFWVRTNCIDSEYFEKDWKLCNDFKNIGVVIPKYSGQRFYESANSKVIVLIEDFKSLNRLHEIKFPENTFAVGLGLEDMLSVIPKSKNKIKPLIKDIKLRFAQSVKAENLPAIDSVFTDLDNYAALKDECLDSNSFGFDGKFSIHPGQIKIINECFEAEPELIDWAKKITDAAQKNNITGYQKVDGFLISPPKVKKAKEILNYLGE